MSGHPSRGHRGGSDTLRRLEDLDWRRLGLCLLTDEEGADGGMSTVFGPPAGTDHLDNGEAATSGGVGICRYGSEVLGVTTVGDADLDPAVVEGPGDLNGVVSQWLAVFDAVGDEFADDELGVLGEPKWRTGVFEVVGEELSGGAGACQLVGKPKGLSTGPRSVFAGRQGLVHATFPQCRWRAGIGQAVTGRCGEDVVPPVSTMIHEHAGRVRPSRVPTLTLRRARQMVED
jgi:hypothetical protein